MLRQRSHAGLNKGEASNALRRAVFFHRQGEIRDRTFENQSFRASGLSLITAAIVHRRIESTPDTSGGTCHGCVMFLLCPLVRTKRGVSLVQASKDRRVRRCRNVKTY
jgi:hypothetical protein